MLRINQQRSSHGAKSYFKDGLEKGDYYTREEIIGRLRRRFSQGEHRADRQHKTDYDPVITQIFHGVNPAGCYHARACAPAAIKANPLRLTIQI